MCPQQDVGHCHHVTFCIEYRVFLGLLETKHKNKKKDKIFKELMLNYKYFAQEALEMQFQVMNVSFLSFHR